MQQIGATVPLETVAAVTAALAVMMDTTPGRLVVRSVVPLAAAGAAVSSQWAAAGRLEQHLTRSQFGQRVR